MSVLPQVLDLVLSGSRSGWWGLGCPARCAGSLILPLVSFLAGLAFRALTSFEVIFWGRLCLRRLLATPGLLPRLRALLPSASGGTCM